MFGVNLLCFFTCLNRNYHRFFVTNISGGVIHIVRAMLAIGASIFMLKNVKRALNAKI
jgi:hypothetical protein